ncbi:hypothetical protein ACLKA6_008476, partial [Drosophila palustris]
KMRNGDGPAPFNFGDNGCASEWKKRLRGLTIAKAINITKATEKLNWMLHYAGPKIQEVFSSLPEDEEEHKTQGLQQVLVEEENSNSRYATLCRSAKDLILDGNGRKLIEMCESFKLTVLNGRTASDSTGDLTFLRGQASSTIDYCLIEGKWLDAVVDMEVKPEIFSDHLPITTTLLIICPEE